MRTLGRSSSRWVFSLAPETGTELNGSGQFFESTRVITKRRSFSSLLALLVVCVCYGSVSAQTQPLALPFGPETYTRSRLLTDKVTKTFSVQDASGPFDLIVERGDGLSAKSIGAVIRLNGVKILTVAADLNTQKVIKAVTLQQQNTITVDLSGDAGTSVILSISPPPKYTLFTNTDEPRLLRASLADGGMVEYFGDKTSDGMPKTLRSVSVSAPDGRTNTYVLDDQSRLAEVHSFNGLTLKFQWQSETAAIVTAVSADGKIQVTTPIDFSEGTAKRVLASAPSCCTYLPENQQSSAKGSEQKYNHPLLGSASTFDPARWSLNGKMNGKSSASLDAVQACMITARALAPICDKIKWVLGPFSVPGAKKLLCYGLAGAAAASAYGIALVPAILASCEPILTGIQVACTAVVVIDKYDGCTRIKNFFTTVSTIAQNIINGGAPPRTPGHELIKVSDDDGKKIPLILVHGIHGSDDTRDLTKRTPYWDAFVSKFNGDQVLKKIYALYAYQYYSDAEGVQNIAIHLGKKIDAQLADRQHVLLAHSMGGLVAKSYMVDYRHASGRWSGRSGGDTTMLLITLASPHHGTPGANDTDAIKQHMGTGWQLLFGSVNLIYWTQNAGFLSPPSLSSVKPNRSDLRWDNFDGKTAGDVNSWLGPSNGKFAAYSSKTITYGGALKPTTTSLSSGGAFLRLVSVGTAGEGDAGDQKRLEFANDSMIYGLSHSFGITDGMVPLYSSLLCDGGQSWVDAGNTTFFCSSPTRVRRFEPGAQKEVLVDDKTLSITRRPRGYDHLDMLKNSEVLTWVVRDLTITNRVVVSTSLTIDPGKGPYAVGQSLGGTFTITNRGTAELDTRQILIAGRVGNTCPNKTCPDFSIRKDIKLAPNKSYSYSGNFTPSQPGTYSFSVAYETPDGTWVMPVDTEKGTVNKLELVVPYPPPTLTRASPPSLGASPNPQNVTLFGTGLSRILYCWVQYPDGKGTFIYIPLSQVKGRSDTQMETRIKFQTRGTYYISAFTMDKGRSNALAITVN